MKFTISPRSIDHELDRIAGEELEHMSELADRILELGGGPETDLEDSQKIANCGKVVFPRNHRDLEGVLNAGLPTRRAESRFLPCPCE